MVLPKKISPKLDFLKNSVMLLKEKGYYQNDLNASQKIFYPH